MNRSELRALILQAFPREEPPPFLWSEPGRSHSDGVFIDRPWWTIAPVEACQYRESMFFMDRRTFLYYLPGFLKASLESEEYDVEIASAVSVTLGSNEDETLERYAKRQKRIVSGLSHAQRQTIYDYLVYFSLVADPRANPKDHFLVLENDLTFMLVAQQWRRLALDEIA